MGAKVTRMELSMEQGANEDKGVKLIHRMIFEFPTIEGVASVEQGESPSTTSARSTTKSVRPFAITTPPALR